MALRTDRLRESWLVRRQLWAGSDSSELCLCRRASCDLESDANLSTESIASLALVENYVPPGEEAPVDPILASVVRFLPSTPHPPALNDEVFFGCKCLRARVRERKTHVDTSVAFLLTRQSPLPLLITHGQSANKPESERAVVVGPARPDFCDSSPPISSRFTT